MKHQILIQPKGLRFQASESETILDAAARAGIKMLKSCDNGVCEICRAQLVEGTVGSSKGERHANQLDTTPVLPCVSYAKSDVILEQSNVLAPGEIPLQHIAFQIKGVTPCPGDVYDVELLAPAGKIPVFHAGQYLELLINDGEYPFTIASAPGERTLHLHLGVSSDNQSSQDILNHLQTQLTVRARLPRGSVWLRPKDNPMNLHDPLVFIVAGTGFSQAKAMIEDQLKHQHSAMFLYWINRDDSGFYSELPQQWHDQGLLEYKALTPETPSSPFFSELPVQDWVHNTIANLDQAHYVLCGGPGFVYSVLEGLESKGVNESQVMSDVFAYAPRPARQ